MPDDVQSPERVRAALDEVLGWQGISRSPQLAELLRYVVERTLAGDSANIKAYSIAVDVFGRPADFDPQLDPIVRVQARRLRSLLEQYYATGLSRSGVEIQLPLGRYVPEFRASGTAPPPESAADPAPTQPPAPGRLPLGRFLLNAGMALAFALAGVLVAVALVRWTTPPSRPVSPVPEIPAISVGTFDNLTGETVLDDDLAKAATELEEALGRFSLLRVGEGGYTINATVQMQERGFVLRATLDRPDGDPEWTTTVEPPPGQTDTEALTAATNVLAARLGSPGGPLHKRGRSWLAAQTALPAPVTAYVCDLLLIDWREGRRLAEAERAAACFAQVLKSTPDDALALAAWADVTSWRERYEALPGSDLVAASTAASAAAGRAVTLAPDVSFVYEQQASVLSRQGSLGAALGSARKAIDLNPMNMDAVAGYGLLLFGDGQYDEGARHAEEALSTIDAPSWYYLVRALNAIRQERFFDAIDAAQTLSVDDELRAVLALAAAPRAGRTDLIDRYRPQVLGNPRYQRSGIMPRVETRVYSEGVLRRIRQGLVLAGIPTSALDGPFRPDGRPVDRQGG